MPTTVAPTYSRAVDEETVVVEISVVMRPDQFDVDVQQSLQTSIANQYSIVPSTRVIVSCASCSARRLEDTKIALAVTILPDLNDPKKESSGITGAGAGSYVAPKDALKSLQDDLSKGKLKEVTKLDIPAQVIVIVTRTPTRAPTTLAPTATRAPTALFADFKNLSPEATQILGGAGGGAALLLLVVFICCKRAKNKKLRQEKQRRLEEDMQSIAPGLLGLPDPNARQSYAPEGDAKKSLMADSGKRGTVAPQVKRGTVTPGAGPASLYPDPGIGAYGDTADPELPPMRTRPDGLPPVRTGFAPGGGIPEAVPVEPYGLDSIHELQPDRRKSVRKSIMHA